MLLLQPPNTGITDVHKHAEHVSELLMEAWVRLKTGKEVLWGFGKLTLLDRNYVCWASQRNST